MNTTSPNSEPANADIILFIHGLWLTPRSWENWAARYESRGYRVLAPSWPGMEAEVEELNRDPSPIARLDITQIADHYEKLIRNLNKPPIIMGHSLGGTIMQLLLDRGLGAAGVGVAAGTVKGVPDLPLSTIWATLPVLGNPFNPGKATPLSPGQFHYGFTNTLSEEESNKIYERYHVPCANRVLFEVAFQSLHRDAATAVSFDKDDRAPLLFIAFEHDHIVPPNASRHNAEKYANPKVITEFHEFMERPHFPGAPGWEEVADYALNWATQMTKRS
jgi:pimeloyl-ACP methyl ester carboxylesterase